MKGVLVVPNVALHGWGIYHMPGRRHNSLPHGLLSVATEMRRGGHDVSILDLRQRSCMENAVRDILAVSPEFVGCGPMTVDFGIALTLFENLKERAPEITTVMGGVHASVSPRDAEASPHVDYIVTGEAEWTLSDMADKCFVGFGRVTKGEPPALDTLLPIDRELVDYRDGELTRGGAWNSVYPYVTVMVGRGCPFHCSFCAPVSTTMFGPKARLRPVAHVMWELSDLMRRYKPAYIEFIDDLFTLKDIWVAEFLAAYPRVCIETPFNVASRADTIVRSPAMFAKLRAIGLDTVNVGLESGCQRHLDFLGKRTTVAQNYEACKILKGLGLKIVGNIIHGIPGETPRETMETVALVKDGGVDYYSPSYLTPYPGCALREEYGKDFLPGDYKDMHRHATNAKMKGVDYGAIHAILKGEGLR